MNLQDFWIEESKNQGGISKKKPVGKNRQRRVFYSVLAVALLVGIGVGLNLPRGEERASFLAFLKNSPEEVKLPEVVLGEKTSSEKTQSGGIRVLSANLIGIYKESKQSKNGSPPVASGTGQAQKENEATGSAATESAQVRDAPQRQLAGIRILGELKNIGKEKIQNARPIVKFYKISGKKQNIIATKLAAFNESYKFLPLSPGEENVYDVLVANPPSSDSVTIEFEVAPEDEEKDSSKLYTNLLKITDRKLKKEVVKNNGKEVSYYKFEANLLNPTQDAFVSPGIYVWIKNETGRVIGFGKKIYEADLLVPEATISAQVNVLPVNAEEMFEYETKTFTEKF